jgi:hypothetical protein
LLANGFRDRLGRLAGPFNDAGLPALTEVNLKHLLQHRLHSRVTQMLLMLQIHHQLPRGLQACGQEAALHWPTTRTFHFHLPGLNHHRLAFRQFGELPADHPPGLGLTQISATRAMRDPRRDDLVRLLHPRPRHFSVPRSSATGLRLRRLRSVHLLIARRGLRRVARVRRRCFQARHFRLQGFDGLAQLLNLLGQLQYQIEEFILRQVVQFRCTLFAHGALYNIVLLEKS